MSCECDEPICSTCDLPVILKQKKPNFREIKEDISSSELMETVPKEKMERAFNFTLKTFPPNSLMNTKSAIEGGQSGNELLSTFFEDIGDDYEPLRFLINCLTSGEDDIDDDVIQQLKNYGDKIPMEKVEEDMTTCVQCSSPTLSSSEGGFVFSHVSYVPGSYSQGIEVQAQEESSRAEGNFNLP